MNYKKMYYILYAAVVCAERRNSEAVKLLRYALDECEKLYLEEFGKPIPPNNLSDDKTAGG